MAKRRKLHRENNFIQFGKPLNGRPEHTNWPVLGLLLKLLIAAFLLYGLFYVIY